MIASINDANNGIKNNYSENYGWWLDDIILEYLGDANCFILKYVDNPYVRGAFMTATLVTYVILWIGFTRTTGW